MECTWLIYVNVIDCAEVMMNSFCLGMLFVLFVGFFSVVFPSSLDAMAKRIFISSLKDSEGDFECWFDVLRVKNERYLPIGFVLHTYQLTSFLRYMICTIDTPNIHSKRSNWHNEKHPNALNQSFD